MWRQAITLAEQAVTDAEASGGCAWRGFSSQIYDELPEVLPAVCVGRRGIANASVSRGKGATAPSAQGGAVSADVTLDLVLACPADTVHGLTYSGPIGSALAAERLIGALARRGFALNRADSFESAYAGRDVYVTIFSVSRREQLLFNPSA